MSIDQKDGEEIPFHMNACWKLLLPSSMCCVIAVFCKIYKDSELFFGVTHPVSSSSQNAFLSCFGGPTPSVLFLFLLVAVVGHGPLMLALLMAFVFWCPVCCCGASACFPWAVFVPCGGLWLMFIFWCFEASGRCLICFLALAALPLCCISLLVGCGWPWSFPA